MTKAKGFQTPESGKTDYNAMTFLVWNVLSKVNTVTLVKVISCTNSGSVAPVGFVDVQPLVNQEDGFGKAIPHGVLHQLPYFRMQGGANAVIMDPQKDDIGIACFCNRDISAVKATKGQNVPGSYRQFDMADGLYLGGVLNGTPTQYIEFLANGMKMVSPGDITINGVTIDPAGNVTAPSGATIAAPTINGTTTLTVNGLDMGSHYHGGVQPGTGNTGGPL